MTQKGFRSFQGSDSSLQWAQGGSQASGAKLLLDLRVEVWVEICRGSGLKTGQQQNKNTVVTESVDISLAIVWKCWEADREWRHSGFLCCD